MAGRTWILLFLIASLIITAASADCIGDAISLTSNKEWVVANKSDSSLITVHVANASGLCTPSDSPVLFGMSDLKYGSLTPLTETTSSGVATTTFKTSSVSGSVNLTAKVNGRSGSYSQKIDHDKPYTVTFDYDSEVIVNETTTVIATLTDKWGNPVDNRRITESVYFAVGSPTGGAGFYNAGSYTDEITLGVDGAGTVSAVCKVDTVAGDNIVYMQHLGSIPDKYFTITGISEAVPVSMTAEITPQPYVYANGIDTFSLRFSLQDAFGNPSGNRTIWVNTSIGESTLLRSNSFGEITATYGPKSIASVIQILVTVVDNPALQKTLTAEFVSTAPTNMIVSANPETMGSWDVPGATPATISAKVMDAKGNPVPNETVSFTIVSFTNTTALASLPSFSSSSHQTSATATTQYDVSGSANGIASVDFYPGAFPTYGPYYNETATGTATILVTWGSSTGSVIVTFKNYPYLRVQTSVDPTVVMPNETFDVHIELIGDGWALQAKPIDSFLVIDRSGSMLYDDPDRMYSVREAAKQFVNQMSGTDQVGLVTFGRTGYISTPGVNSGISLCEIDNTYPGSPSSYGGS